MMRTRMKLTAALLGLCLGLAACNGEPAAEPAEEPGDAAPGAATVSIEGSAFQPAAVEVPVGGAVTWTNNDSFAHTVTFEDGPDSGSLEPGATHERMFDEAGEHAYVCAIHPQMTATVTVTG